MVLRQRRPLPRTRIATLQTWCVAASTLRVCGDSVLQPCDHHPRFCLYVFSASRSRGVGAGRSFVQHPVGLSDACASTVCSCRSQVKAHPNIIRLYDVIWDCDLRKKHGTVKNPSVCLVMELAPKGELFDYVALEPFPDSLAHAYFGQLMSGKPLFITCFESLSGLCCAGQGSSFTGCLNLSPPCVCVLPSCGPLRRVVFDCNLDFCWNLS